MFRSKLFCAVCCVVDGTAIGFPPIGLSAGCSGVSGEPFLSACVVVAGFPFSPTDSWSLAFEVVADTSYAAVFVSMATIVGTFEVTTTLVWVGGPTIYESISVSYQPVAAGSSTMSRPEHCTGSYVTKQLSSSSNVCVAFGPSSLAYVVVIVVFAGMEASAGNQLRI